MRINFNSTSLQNACVITICIWALTPPLAFSTSARLLSLVAVGLWLMIEATRARGVMRTPTMPVLALFIYVFYTIIMEALTHGTEGLLNSTQLYIMLFFLLVQQSRRNQTDALFTVFWSVIALNVVWMTSTYIFLSSNDARAMRLVVRSTEEARELVEQGVGGYSMAYGAVLMLPALLMLSLRPALITQLKPPRLLRVIRPLPTLLIWYLTALSAIIVISSQFSIAVLVTLASLIAVFTLWRFSTTRAMLTIASLVLIVGFGEAILIEMLHMLQPLTEGTNYEIKISDIIATLQSDVGVGSANDRMERYTRSLGLFFENPLIGVLYYTDIGKHSTLLDDLARWGLVIGGILLYLVSFLQLRAIKQFSKTTEGFGAALGALFAVILVFGLNKHFMAAGIIIFLINPIVFGLLLHSKPQTKKSGHGGNTCAT